MINSRAIYGTKNTVGDIGWAWNLKKMPAGTIPICCHLSAMKNKPANGIANMQQVAFKSDTKMRSTYINFK